VNRVNAENKSVTGAGIEVAVLDTGIDLTHPDLKANILGGKNCMRGGTYNDGNGHGTHVAGTVAAINNTIGVVGVAPAAKLWSVRVLDNAGNGTWSSVICGIDFVTSQASHIKVANMSLGGAGVSDSCSSPTASALHRAICNSVAAGVTYVVAAGNEADDLKNHVPAAYPEVIAVSALADSNGAACGGGAATNYGPDDTFATFSNYATLLEDSARLIGAPGVSILSTWKGGGYNTINGTSMATPHVAGAAALFLETHSGATPAQVLSGLLMIAEPKDTNVNGECAAGFSHTAGTLHPEPVLRADSL
jgi:subtilisin family serine protease